MKKRAAVCICCVAFLCVLLGGKCPVMAQEASGEGKTQQETTFEGKTVTISTDRVLANGLFSVTMPDEFEGLYVGLISDQRIIICDKLSREYGASGMVFEIFAYDPSANYVGIPSLKKYGQLTSQDGTVYDITCSRPTDMQAGYKDGKRSETYDTLREAEEQIMENIAGAEGCSYAAGAGKKGEDLYQDVLKKYVTAVTEKWNAARLEEEGMSPVYELIGKIHGEAALEKICFAYTDLTSEGVEELLVGEVTDGDQKFKVYDIYTVKDHKPAHVLSGWNDSWYYAGEIYLYNVYRGLNGEEYWAVLDPAYSISYEKTKGYSRGMEIFVIDPVKNEEQPWFMYGYEGSWINLSKEDYEERFSRSVKLKEIEPRPLSEPADDR